jgi:hypothetical protein
MKRIPETPEFFLALLRARHRTLLAGRPETSPGEFKDRSNQFGTLVFVAPDEIAGTLVEQYLVNRGIDVEQLPNDMAEVLRWHPRCLWEQGYAACMVALWTDVRSNAPKAIHRTALTPKAEGIDRMSFGPTRGCVIRLWPDEVVEYGLVLGEGVETVLAAATRIEHRATLLRPAWAAGDAGHIEDFPALSGIDALTILVDHDANGEGQRHAAMCAIRWRAAGREVIRLVPRDLGDFNDIIRGVAP